MTLMISSMIGFGVVSGGAANKTLLQIIQDLSLDTNLELCLDAGDANSYTSGTKWLDVSGNGYDFFFGAGAGASTDDPSFNGSAGGLSKAEFMSGDGGDFFRYDSSNETFMTNWHKDNADFTVASVVYVATGVGQSGIMGTGGNDTGNVGVDWKIQAGNACQIGVWKGGAPGALNQSSSATLPDDAFSFAAVAIDEATGGTASHFNINGTTETFDGTYTTPSSSAATYTAELCAVGNGQLLPGNGFRMACHAVWSEALSTTQTGNIRTEIMARFA